MCVVVPLLGELGSCGIDKPLHMRVVWLFSWFLLCTIPLTADACELLDLAFISSTAETKGRGKVISTGIDLYSLLFFVCVYFMETLVQCFPHDIQRGGSEVGSLGSHWWENGKQVSSKSNRHLFIVEGNTAHGSSALKGGNGKKHHCVRVDLDL